MLLIKIRISKFDGTYLCLIHISDVFDGPSWIMIHFSTIGPWVSAVRRDWNDARHSSCGTPGALSAVPPTSACGWHAGGHTRRSCGWNTIKMREKSDRNTMKHGGKPWYFTMEHGLTNKYGGFYHETWEDQGDFTTTNMDLELIYGGFVYQNWGSNMKHRDIIGI